MHLPFLWDLGEKWGKSVSFAAPSHPTWARCRCQGLGSSPRPGEVLHPTGRLKTLKEPPRQRSWKEQSGAQGHSHLSGKGLGELLLTPTLPRASLRAEKHGGARRNEMKKRKGTNGRAVLAVQSSSLSWEAPPTGKKCFFFMFYRSPSSKTLLKLSQLEPPAPAPGRERYGESSFQMRSLALCPQSS